MMFLLVGKNKIIKELLTALKVSFQEHVKTELVSFYQFALRNTGCLICLSTHTWITPVSKKVPVLAKMNGEEITNGTIDKGDAFLSPNLFTTL